MNITLQGGWSGIYSKSGVYINGHIISVYIDKLPKCKYLIVRKFTK